MSKYSIFLLGVTLLLGACTHKVSEYPEIGGLETVCQQDSVNQYRPDIDLNADDLIELRNLNDGFLRLNGQFGIAGTKSGNWSWPRFWAITGSDVVGSVVFSLFFDWWIALGGGVYSSIKSYTEGKAADHQWGGGSTSPSTNSNSHSFYETTSFLGYDENGVEMNYDAAGLEEDPEYIDIEEEIREHLGVLHNEIIITLCNQYGDSLATFSNYTIIDKSLELVASWYGLDDSEIPYFEIDDDFLESCVLESEEDFDSLTEDYPGYSGYFTIVENYIVAISQLETSEQVLAYKAQATNLIQNSNLSSPAKSTLLSGLDVMISSKGLWIYNDELVEEDEGEDEGGDE